MKNKRFLITGASGFIGGLLFEKMRQFDAIGVGFKISEQDKIKGVLDADLRNEETAGSLLAKADPDIIFHLAALVAPKVNEDNPRLAKESHIDVTRNVLKHMKKDSHIIFLSTDKVFDGIDTCPDECSKPNPTSLYGKLKREAEDLIRKSVPKHHIFRLPIVHAMGEPRSSSFVDKSLIALKGGNKISAFTNVKRCYIRVNELVELLVTATDDENYGIYHVGSDMATYYDRIKNLCDETNIEYEGLLEQGKGEVFPLIQNLDRSKAQKVFGIKFN